MGEHVVAIDIGSTDIKVNGNKWKQYSLEMVSLPEVGEVTLLQGQSLEAFRQLIVTDASQVDPDVWAVTGAKNPLWISMPDAAGTYHDIILFDKPKPPLARIDDSQRQALCQILDLPENSQIPAESALNKLLLVMQNPALRTVDGQEIDFHKIRISGLMGFAAYCVTGSRDAVGIPESDVSAFGLNGASPDQVRHLFSYLGFIDEVNYRIDPAEVRFDGKKIFAMNDFAAEMNVLRELVLEGKIKPGTFVALMDSVFKYVLMDELKSGWKHRGKDSYVTQRTGAAINSEYNHPILDISKSWTYALVNEVAQRLHSSDRYFFDPEDNDSKGQLYRRDSKRGWVPLSIQSFHKNSLNMETRKEVVNAVVLGTLLRMAELMRFSDKVMYAGGFVNATNRKGEQRGAQRAALRVSPKGAEVSRLVMPGAGEAMVIVYRHNHEGVEIESQVEIKSLGRGVGKGELIGPWLKQRDYIQRKNKTPNIVTR